MTDYISRDEVLKLVEPDARPFLAYRIMALPAADVIEKQKVLEIEQARLEKELKEAELSYLQNTIDSTYRAILNSANIGNTYPLLAKTKKKWLRGKKKDGES